MDEDEVKPTATLQGDLGAESIDFLDIVFRLEREFGDQDPARASCSPSRSSRATPTSCRTARSPPRAWPSCASRCRYADLAEFEKNPELAKHQRPVHGRPDRHATSRASWRPAALSELPRSQRIADRSPNAVASADYDSATPTESSMRWIWIDRFVDVRVAASRPRRSRTSAWPRTTSPTTSPATRSCRPRSSSRGWPRPAASWSARPTSSRKKVVLAKIPKAKFQPRGPGRRDRSRTPPPCRRLSEVGGLVARHRPRRRRADRRGRDLLRPRRAGPTQGTDRVGQLRLHRQPADMLGLAKAAAKPGRAGA